jgi:hypothetical protein
LELAIKDQVEYMANSHRFLTDAMLGEVIRSAIEGASVEINGF